MPWALLAAILVFSALVGIGSAGVPARTVARSDTLAALRGARRPQRPRASRPIWGSVLLLVGVGVTLGCAFLLLSLDLLGVLWDSPLRAILPFGIVIGPILVQLGILLSGRWLLWITSRGLSRLGLAARLAARDAAANASRTVPAFAAIGATVFIAVFALGQTAMQNAQTARSWAYAAPVGSLSLALYPGGDDAEELTAAQAAEGVEAALELAESAGASDTAVIARQPGLWSYASAEEIPAELTWTIAVLPERYLIDPASSYMGSGQDPQNPLSVIAPDEIDTALGVTLTPSQRSAYLAGAAIVTDARFAVAGRVDLAAWSGRDVYEGRVPNNIWQNAPGDAAIATPVWEREQNALVIELPLQPTVIAIAPQTAEELGIEAKPSQVIASFDAPVPSETRDRIQAESETLSTPEVIVAPYVEDGPPDGFVWMIPILATVSVLVLGASAVALSLARIERRPDDATLAAVGGTRGLRRRIGFWQGLVIAGFGTLAGAVAGVLPPIGFAIQSAGMLQIPDIPWLVLAFLTVALPLSIAIVSWLVPPRAPDLTRRTVIA